MRYNGINILSIDAKDIYLANSYKDNETLGYNIRYKDGSINIKKFINSLDYSLEVRKLQEVYKKVYRNNAFTFRQDNHDYTTKIINITFKYSNKEFNKIRKNTYVKFGYNLNTITFQDHICIIENKLIAIETNCDIQVPVSDNILGNSFFYENGQYHAKTNIGTLNTVEDLRKKLYENGFYCDGIKYIRYKRSSGSSRVGKCLFIDERLYKRMHKWELCGLTLKEGQEVDLAAMEAYIALTLSSIIDTIEIKPENILIIDDYESEFTEEVIETRLNGDWLASKPNTVTIRNSIWDGQSLGDESLFVKYPEKGMLLIRNQFCKSAVFHAKIQKWFKDHQITDIKQLNGFTLAHNVEDIKLITTPSSIKYLKFSTAKQWFDNIDSAFGIVKHEKPTPYFNGRMVQTHYQLLNTLQLTEAEMRDFLKPSLEYIKMLKNDPSVVRYHIKYPIYNEFEVTPLTSKNDIVYKMLGINNNFAKTKLFYDFKSDLAKAYTKNLRNGHVLVHGNYSTLLGNPVEMLQQAIGSFNGTSLLGIGNVHSKNFAYHKILLGSRSPHVTIGNVWLPYNIPSNDINTYFNLSNEILCINSIGESVLDRLSGCDFDSDSVLLTDDEILIQAACKNYAIFKVPVNHVESIKRKRKYTSLEKADLDIKNSNNKIGELINLSQELNTILWDRMNKGSSYQNIEDLYCDICQLDVMSGIEIDKAKKEFVVDTYKEMQKIKEKWIVRDEKNRIIKPNFFGYIARVKGYYDTEKKNYLRHETSMDYLQKVINQFQVQRNDIGVIKNIFLPFHDILNKEEYNTKSIKYDQVNKLFAKIDDINNKIKKIYADNIYEAEERYHIINTMKQECFDSISHLTFSKSTMLYMLEAIERKEYRHVSRIIFNTLFAYPNTSFYSIIKDSIEPIDIFKEAPDGDISVFHFNFTKSCRN